MFFIFIKCLQVFLINIFILDILYNTKVSVFNPQRYNNLYDGNLNLFNNDNKTIYELNYLKNLINTTYYFKVDDIRYCFSFKHRMVKIEYNISFYDEKQNFISPTEIAQYKNISLLCSIIYSNISIDSLANIKENKYFNCIEFFNLNERISIGVKVYNIFQNLTYNYTFLFTDNIFNYKKIQFNNDKKFDSLIINYEYNSLIQNINNTKLQNSVKLKKSYIKFPLHLLKRKYIIEDNYWKFENILGEYFCFSQGKRNSNLNISQYCKYNFYIKIIDNSREL